MKSPHILFLNILIFIVVSSCEKNKEGIDCSIYHWEYNGESNPSTWATCFTECDGQSQSPINITNPQIDKRLTRLEISYKAVPIKLINNQHTIEFEYENGSNIRLNGEDYALLQFHFHTGSEHTVDDKRFPMEVHLVHQSASNGQLVVVSVFFLNKGAENKFLNSFIDHLPEATGDFYTSFDLVNIKDLFPSDSNYYTYKGSSTTPPCSEIVTWFVMKSPVKASGPQIQKMHKVIGHNCRPVQLLKGRIVREFNK